MQYDDLLHISKWIHLACTDLEREDSEDIVNKIICNYYTTPPIVVRAIGSVHYQ